MGSERPVRLIGIAVGERIFPPDQWQKALISWLNAIWAGAMPVLRFVFGNMKNLCLNPTRDGEQYICWGNFRTDPITRESELDAGPDGAQLERGLMRFAWNESIRSVTLHFWNGGFVELRKLTERELEIRSSPDFPARPEWVK